MAGFGTNLPWEAVGVSGKVGGKDVEESFVGKERDIYQKEQPGNPHCTTARQGHQTTISTF